MAGLVALLIAVLMTAAMGGVASAQQKLIVYSILQQDYTIAMLEAFTKATGIPADFIRASGGQMVARVIAEKGAPQADVVLGGASNLHEAMKAEGALRAYRSPAAEAIPEQFKDSDGYWTGFYLTALGIGVNRPRFERLYPGKPLPKTWDDLTDPDLRGEVVVTDPVASSTSYLFLNTILQGRGWDEGWEYLQALYNNVGQWPTSGSAPPRMIGTGEYALGVSFVHSFAAVMQQGYQLDLIVPPATGGDAGSVSIIAGGPNPELAERFVDWVLGEEAQKLHSDISLTTPTLPDLPLAPGVMALETIDFINYDPVWAGENRERILDQWSRIAR